MKIIHFADLHIGSKFERMPDDIKTELNIKLRNAFAKIIDYAKVNNITTTIVKKIRTFEKDVKEFKLNMINREKSVSEFALEIGLKNPSIKAQSQTNAA